MKKFNLTDLLIFVVTAELVGAVSALIAGNFSAFYSEIIQPPLSPPAKFFPVVWGILYALMGISAYLVSTSGRPYSLKVYNIQLAVNFAWSIVFFRFRLLGISAVLAVVLLILVGVMIMQFCKVRKISAGLNIPYLLWSAFAVYLAVAICIIN
ncbi:MAG: tryptophan-rich sensory protein [Ruminococcus flavefaciens]|nr:tryptophan-rich sensory protein [Ruminococcus flavefaciens]